jgi:hypothetical protein
MKSLIFQVFSRPASLTECRRGRQLSSLRRLVSTEYNLLLFLQPFGEVKSEASEKHRLERQRKAFGIPPNAASDRSVEANLFLGFANTHFATSLQSYHTKRWTSETHGSDILVERMAPTYAPSSGSSFSVRSTEHFVLSFFCSVRVLKVYQIRILRSLS